MALNVVTVFGGSGFIGRYVVRRLAQLGAVVRAPVRHAEQAGFLRPMGDVGQVTPFRIDIRNAAEVARAIEGADAIVNLIGLLAPSGDQQFAALQAEAPATMAHAAVAAGVERFVQVSAIGADAASKSAYARTKAAGETALRAAIARSVILRPSIVFGPEDQFFNRFAQMTRLSPALPLIGGGATRFQPVYVGDVADAAIAALLNPSAAGQTYELGGPRIYSFHELMELMLAIIGKRRRLVTIPFGLAELQARVAELLPNPPLTRDQVVLLKQDNIVHRDALTLETLGVPATALETILPTYLDRFRTGGMFAKRAPLKHG